MKITKPGNPKSDNWHIDPGALEAARAARDALQGVSPERVAEELRRILARPRAARAAIDSSWVFVGAALATGLSSLGAGFAVAKVGTAAVGALAEKPDLFGRLLIFIGLAEGIAIYGLIVSILMLNRLG